MSSRKSRRVAVVTGAASGIGAATVQLLADRGWLVAGMDVAASGADWSIEVDVTDEAGVRDAFVEVEDHCGPVRALVTCAGHYEMAPFVEILPAQWDKMLRVHIGGFYNCCRACLPQMCARHCGEIVAITSELGVGGGDGDSHYAAAKGALIAIVRSLAQEVVGDGVYVNSVAPGPCDTPLLVPDSPWRAPAYLQSLPLRRLVTPGEVASAVVFLLEAGRFFVGDVVSPNGGAMI
ncbi:MAG: SDR family NAD(P)-dependent oxidoreductase [Acidimicrobiales bacterium]